MKPEPEQHVKCILKNNALVEGIVKEWGDSEIVLKSLDEKSLLIIHGGTQDIVFTKVILEEVKLPKNTENIGVVIANKIKETLDIPEEQVELKNKSVEELVQLRDEQERRIISDKLKEHSASEVRTIKYGTPGLFTKQRPK